MPDDAGIASRPPRGAGAVSGGTASSGAGAHPRTGRFARVVAAGEELRVADVAGMAAERGLDIARMPYVARAILENLVRQVARNECEPERLDAVLDWRNAAAGTALPLAVSRLVMPDSSGIPVLADLAALRDVVAQEGGDPAAVRFAVPAHLVVDHSVQVDVAGVPEALMRNLDREFERNGERYRFLKWAQQAFDGIRIVPPGTGIIHQIQVERLANPVALGPALRRADRRRRAGHRDRLAHADGQRHRRDRLGRGRHRGRDRAPRQPARGAEAVVRRRAAHRAAAARRRRGRRRAGRHRAAAP